MPGDIQTYIDERKADTLNQAAVLADDYTLTHKTSFSQNSSQDHLKTNVDSSGSSPHMMNGRKQYIKHNSFSGGNRTGPIPPGPDIHYCKREDRKLAFEQQSSGPTASFQIQHVSHTKTPSPHCHFLWSRSSLLVTPEILMSTHHLFLEATYQFQAQTVKYLLQYRETLVPTNPYW